LTTVSSAAKFAARTVALTVTTGPYAEPVGVAGE